jgi:transposase
MVKLYKKGSHISRRKYREILRYFSEDINAVSTARLSNVNRTTINKIFLEIRQLIAKECEKNAILEVGEIELDESYFGARRVRGKRGRGAKGKTPVFGLLKRGDKVYTQILNNCSAAVLLPIIEEMADKDSIIYTDGFKSYDGLVDYGYKQHYRIIHSKNKFADGRNHINGIENF